MGLIQRKVRPLARDKATLRDDRLFIVACDDTYAPKQYFDFFNITRVQVFVVPTEKNTSHALHALNRLVKYDHDEDDELWLLLDTDHCIKGQHLKAFTNALKEAKDKKVHVALSRPCFELWLLLHHEEDMTVINSLIDANETEATLRAKLGQYNKTKLNQEHYTLTDVRNAILRAEQLDAAITGGDIPDSNTSRVYLLWKAIVEKALPSQLPTELRQLMQ